MTDSAPVAPAPTVVSLADLQSFLARLEEFRRTASLLHATRVRRSRFLLTLEGQVAGLEHQLQLLASSDATLAALWAEVLEERRRAER